MFTKVRVCALISYGGPLILAFIGGGGGLLGLGFWFFVVRGFFTILLSSIAAQL